MYKVVHVDKWGKEKAAEKACNEVADAGWQLVTAAPDQAGGLYLFFRR